MIYYFDNYDFLETKNVEEILPKKRLDKYYRLRNSRDKENCFAAYILLRYALKKEYGITDFTIECDENAKPYLKDSNNIYFNISHCSKAVVVVLSDSNCGIDIQPIAKEHTSVMNRVYSAEEREEVLTSQNSAEKFTKLWTLKESIIKCNGAGLTHIGDYSFEKTDWYFKKHSKSFSVFKIKNNIISVCGDDYFSQIETMEKTED